MRLRISLATILVILISLSCLSALQASPDRPVPKRLNREPAVSWVTLQRRYPGVFIMNGSRQTKRVALTFDDAPDPRYTPAILDTLAAYKVRATFFIIGSRAVEYPTLVKRIHKEGHDIGNHSYNHAVFSLLSESAYRKQLGQTDDVLASLVGYHPRFIRPPYGEVLPSQVAWAKLSGYVIVNWDVDSVDWRSLSSSLVLRNIRKTLQPGSIILQHAGGGSSQDLTGTVKALPELIVMLRKSGYELVTLSELLHKTASLQE
ncbi:polysaccharide deacetylase family protein [Paenibacillus sp. GCM10023252]|uniref:polysaccharide deacetylase family protein n=1 Tax=Paenibacillus sp. GCM10023252 TaxID=3252649 RepID=UPI00360CE905